MILVDANLLVYAAVVSMPQHKRAKEWLDGKLNGPAPVGMPWPCLLGFLRLVTNSRVFNPPLSSAAAWKVIGYWLDCPAVWIPAPTERHRETLGRMVEQVKPRGNLVPDAHRAALAVEHGLILCSTDRDFSRFPGLRWEDPIGS